MLRRVFKDDRYRYTRITKHKARTLFLAGTAIYFCPCNMQPGGPAHFGSLIEPERHLKAAKEGEDAFDIVNRDYAHYNSDNHEVGYYNSFYLRELKTS